MIALLVLLLAAPQAATASPPVVQGTVTDASGSRIAGAIVVIDAGGTRWETTSGPDGRFAAPAPAADARIEIAVRAPGFAEARRVVTDTAPVVIMLQPAPLNETITVAATRSEQRTGDVPASVTLLSSRDIRSSAAVTTDDVLRQVPSFSLFRRTSSLVSHPTTQGVSLRGIGPSGVSRTLVLVDGIPANDPFGGWVYWSRVPIEQAERIEVAEGPASSLYGNYAMGGVINIVTARAAPKLFMLRTQYGSERTRVADVSAGGAWRRVSVIASGGGLATDGYTPVAAAERGPIDTHASMASRNAAVKVEYDPRDTLHLFARGGYFHERRDNGKASSIDGTPEANATWWRALSGGLRQRSQRAGEFEVLASGTSESFRSNFLAVPPATPPRSVARATLNQEVPARDADVSARWSRAFGDAHVLTAGGDWRRVAGESREEALDPATGTHVTRHRASGGREQTAGLYVQDMFVPSAAVVITASARIDRWRTDEGHNLETLPSGAPTAANMPALPDRSGTVASPRLAALVRVHPHVQVWGGAAGGFRAPTLNELYRQFRVGATLTLPNAALDAEHLAGLEGGVTVTPSGRAMLRATLFDNHLRGPISNVTISSSASSIVQQRRNLGRTRTSGAELDAEYRVEGRWTLAASYIYTHAVVTDNPAAPDLVGHVLAQVPAHRGSARATYVHPRVGSLAMSVRFAGAQYDDDRNTPGRQLPAYAVVDVQGARPVRDGIEIFLSAQNLLDRQYWTGTLPTTVGLPRLVSAGVRIRLGGH